VIIVMESLNQGISTRLYSIDQAPLWETLWAPYDSLTYLSVLQEILPNDYVVDIGAGDLRLSFQMAAVAQRVEAVEIQPEIVRQGPPQSAYPQNLRVHITDALTWPFPNGISAAVLLMRHCTHFQDYAEKLRQVGCQRLITNARWRMDVEVIDLFQPRLPFQQVQLGWFACWCGAVGFKPGPVENIDSFIDHVQEVISCPNCNPETDNQSLLDNQLLQKTNHA